MEEFEWSRGRQTTAWGGSWRSNLIDSDVLAGHTSLASILKKKLLVLVLLFIQQGLNNQASFSFIHISCLWSFLDWLWFRERQVLHRVTEPPQKPIADHLTSKSLCCCIQWIHRSSLSSDSVFLLKLLQENKSINESSQHAVHRPQTCKQASAATHSLTGIWYGMGWAQLHTYMRSIVTVLSPDPFIPLSWISFC